MTPQDISLNGRSAVAFLIAMAMIGGALVASTGDITLSLVYMATIAGLVLLLQPALLLYLVVLAGLIVVGLFQLYAPHLQLVRWPVSVLSVALGAIVLIGLAFDSSGRRGLAIPAIFNWYLAIVLIILMSALLNGNGIQNFLFGFKGYLQVWGLFIAIALWWKADGAIKRLPMLLIAVGLIQIPFVLHQYFVLVPARTGFGRGVIAEDVIAGTLGATLEGGGANAVLSALLFIAIALVVSAWKRGLVPGWITALAIPALFFPVLLNLSKVSVVYVVAIFAGLFWDELLVRPARFIFGLLLATVLLVGIVSSYTAIQSRSSEDLSWRDFMSNAIQQNTAPEEGYGHYYLNRWTAIKFWVDRQGDRNFLQTLIGYGPGESREASASAVATSTLASRSYPGYGIGLTTIAAVLWELGVLGLCAVVGLFVSGFRSAGKLARIYKNVDPWKSSALSAMQVAIVILGISLFHKDSFIFHLPYQTLVMVVFGYVSYWQRNADLSPVSDQ